MYFRFKTSDNLLWLGLYWLTTHCFDQFDYFLKICDLFVFVGIVLALCFTAGVETFVILIWVP